MSPLASPSLAVRRSTFALLLVALVLVQTLGLMHRIVHVHDAVHQAKRLHEHQRHQQQRERAAPDGEGRRGERAHGHRMGRQSIRFRV